MAVTIHNDRLLRTHRNDNDSILNGDRLLLAVLRSKSERGHQVGFPTAREWKRELAFHCGVEGEPVFIERAEHSRIASDLDPVQRGGIRLLAPVNIDRGISLETEDRTLSVPP